MEGSAVDSSSTKYKWKRPLPFVIRRACDFFGPFAFFVPDQMFFGPFHKIVILSEAPRRSIAEQRVYGAESKDPGDACWQMLFAAFRPQPARKLKKSQPPTGAYPDFLPRSAGHGRVCSFP